MLNQVGVGVVLLSLSMGAGDFSSKLEPSDTSQQTVTFSELSKYDKLAVEKQLDFLWARYQQATDDGAKLAVPPDEEELDCNLYPNGFECFHGKYYVSCNWEEGWCQAGDDWPE